MLANYATSEIFKNNVTELHTEFRQMQLLYLHLFGNNIIYTTQINSILKNVPSIGFWVG
jgi:hypothetical protein